MRFKDVSAGGVLCPEEPCSVTDGACRMHLAGGGWEPALQRELQA